MHNAFDIRNSVFYDALVVANTISILRDVFHFEKRDVFHALNQCMFTTRSLRPNRYLQDRPCFEDK